MIQEKKFSSKINYDILKNLTDGKASDIVSRKPSTLSASAAYDASGGSPAPESSTENSDTASSLSYLPGIVNETPDSSSNVR